MSEKLSKEAVIDLVAMMLTENFFDVKTLELVQRSSLKGVVDRGIRALSTEIVDRVRGYDEEVQEVTDAEREHYKLLGEVVDAIVAEVAEWQDSEGLVGSTSSVTSLNAIETVLRKKGFMG